jgi:Putative prokaryotic signal transducing protein
MPEKLTTIATHLNAQEAHLAKNSLETEGIPAFLADEESDNMLGLMYGFVKGVKLMVAEHQAERAAEVLATLASGPGEAPVDERLAATRTCPVCGEAFEPDCDYCPQCGPPADPTPAPTSEFVQEAPPRIVEEEESATAAGDELARRALWASVIGLILCPPLVTIYAMYLIVRLCFGGMELQPASWRKAYLALAFCVLELVFVALFWRASLARWF